MAPAFTQADSASRPVGLRRPLWHEFATVTLEPRGWLPNGHFGLSIVGCVGQTVDCQSSSNLADWVSLGLQTPDADYYEFEDTTPNTNTARFYRILLVP